MMQVIRYPGKEQWHKIIERPYADNRLVLERTSEILKAVRKNGDEALRALSLQFDDYEPESFELHASEINEGIAEMDHGLALAMQQAYENIFRFHKTQLRNERPIEVQPGIICYRKHVAIDKVGLYIPGGSAPLFSTILMLGIPAKIAGCREMILCTPPGSEAKIHPAILYAAQLVGVNRIFRIGGAQAIAAMAYGTESIPAVHKIFGPGNQYVTAAKQLVQMDGVAIDMPAGPSEVAVLADENADPVFVAADLLSQAEHGADSQVLLVTDSEMLVDEVMKQLEIQTEQLPRKEIILSSLDKSRVVLVKDLVEGMDLVNAHAPEHLILNCAQANVLADEVRNAGSVFIGAYSPESVGDYASGTNHTLPTNGFARAYSGVGVDSFVKKISFQELTPQGLTDLAPAVIAMAEAEGLQAHAEAVRLRMQAPGFNKESVPAGFDVNKLVRKNILDLEPYSSARNEYSGKTGVFLDANENSIGSPLTRWYNRYPDPQQKELKKKIAQIKQSDEKNILLGNGSDECIDLLIRAFCEPGDDHIIICPPTYGMYEVCAHINDIEIREVLLTPSFQLDMDALEQTIDPGTKMIFICSPNNPTGNSLNRNDLEILLNNFDGLVVVDEAYINFSRHRSMLSDLQDYPNLVILQTLSKAWGLAALRVGICFASEQIITILNRIKPPYNISQAAQELASGALDNLEDVNTMIRELVQERQMLSAELKKLNRVQEVYPSDSNFLLVKFDDADMIYQYLKQEGIIVRNRSRLPLCENCLRITIGTGEQNRLLLDKLQSFNP